MNEKRKLAISNAIDNAGLEVLDVFDGDTYEFLIGDPLITKTEINKFIKLGLDSIMLGSGSNFADEGIVLVFE